MKYILTVDQSTFSTKVFLIDEMGQIHASKSIKHKKNYPENNWVEHDASEIYHNLVTATENIKQQHSKLFQDIVGLSLIHISYPVHYSDMTGLPCRVVAEV